MSMELMVKAMKTKVGSPLRKLVLIKLADNANDQSECWPSYQHIADQCEMSRRSVMVHIDTLCRAGVIKKEIRHGGPKGNSSNIYILRLAGGENAAPASESPAPHGESAALGGSESAAPRTSHPSEPVNEPKPLCTDSPMEGFGVFWTLYPNKKGKQDAAAAWKKLNPDVELRQTLMTALANHSASRDWTKDDGQYVPMASTWLNKKRYQDELKPAAKAASNYRDLPDHTDDMYQGAANGNPAF